MVQGVLPMNIFYSSKLCGDSNPACSLQIATILGVNFLRFVQITSYLVPRLKGLIWLPWSSMHFLSLIASKLNQDIVTCWHASFARHQRHRWHAWWHGSHHSHRGAFGFCGLLDPWQRLPHLLRLGSWGALGNWIVHWICGAWRDVIRGSDMARFYNLIQAFKLSKYEHR